FAGNHAFTDADLRDAIASRTSGLMTWFTDRDVFDKRRFQADVQMLQQFYLNRGYLDIRVESSSVVIAPDRLHFAMLYSLQEGIPYHVGRIILRGDVLPDEQTLREKLELASGDLFSMEKLRKSIDAITERVGDEGYAFATVTPEFRRRPEEGKVDIALEIEKGREIYVERIEITGNEKSVDQVVRRELKQDEAARYSSSAIRRSKEALGRTGLFKDTQISLPRGSAPDKVKMKVKVEEEKSGKFTFGVGYSQLEKVFMRTSMSENNLFGRGYRANVSADLGKVTKNYNVSLTDPFFLGEPLAVTVNAFNTSSNQFNTTTVNTLGYSSRSTGGGLSLSVPLTDELSWALGWQYTATTLSNIPAGSSILLQSQAGKQSTGELTQRLIWNSTDSAVAPKRGVNTTLSAGYAGLGGSNRFGSLGLDATGFVSFGEEQDFTLSPSMEFRMIRGLRGQEVPLYRRYSLGGIGSLRGFDALGVSLRDPATQEALGGDRMLRLSLNGFFPIPYMQTAGFRGVLFADAGTVWGTVRARVGNQTFNLSEAFALSKMRASVGFGIEWLSPVGPITMSWGFPVRKQAGDVLRRFEFGLGMGF
ncbi:MAG: outer membrane protein assembly factor BamA, partial [Mariprofundaceae bacterium]